MPSSKDTTRAAHRSLCAFSRSRTDFMPLLCGLPPLLLPPLRLIGDGAFPLAAKRVASGRNAFTATRVAASEEHSTGKPYVRIGKAIKK